MFNTSSPGKSFINKQEYYDKVLGCWTGKNIGGTLGGPFEGSKEINDLMFYSQELNGSPLPNDDLDLQLIWLLAIEEHGIYNINERLLGEYWLNYISAPWNEYGVAKINLANGIFPPLSGYCHNETWKNSNGAWIRSEIWACMFPGEPDEVAPFAWYDACVDHAEDGIYAEIFTAVLESAAFVENDLRKLIDYACSRIPSDCRIVRSVKIVADAYDTGLDWQTARTRVVDDSSDLGWFQAPANLAFVIIGLLYGEGDFGRSLCLAVNCGDDADCTGATCGAILGIMKGRAGIPYEWIYPIGESIKTISLNAFHAELPESLTELTDRVIACKEILDKINPTLIRLTDRETCIGGEIVLRLTDGTETQRRVLQKPSKCWDFILPYGVYSVEFDKSPIVKPGDRQKLKISYSGAQVDNTVFKVEWCLPEGWSLSGGNYYEFMTYVGQCRSLNIELTVGEFTDSHIYIPLVFNISGRHYPCYGSITFEREGVSNVFINEQRSAYQPFYDNRHRRYSRCANRKMPIGI